ncbi:amidohydrolase family protein [Roseateles sp. BYS180W]|uniref:Amidohydrolase family protein n=1 Tax=Roseateles rivi TaxID=3299028 RepID=A0ABW7FZG7_9BURK
MKQLKPGRPLWRQWMVAGAALGAVALGWAQSAPQPPINGLREQPQQWHALTQARVVVAPGQVLDNATVLLRDGRISAVGTQLAIPPGARVWALPGRTVYAGFIELNSHAGQTTPDKDAALPSQHALVRPERSAAAQGSGAADALQGLRELGFTAVLSSPAQGLFRGQGVLLATGGDADARQRVLVADVSQHLGLQWYRGHNATAYPNSLMGAVALTRQTLWDARWWGRAGADAAPNAALAALQAPLQGRQAVFMALNDEQDIGRATRLRDEFKLRMTLLGQGHEYRQLAQLKASAMGVVLPLNFPAAPEVEDPDLAQDIPLQQLQHWQLAPSNPALVAQQGIALALTSQGTAARDFWPHLRLAVRRGLKPEAALAALTTTPAAWLGQDKRLGRIAPGQLAHLVVARGDLFVDEQADIELTFVAGIAHSTEAWQRPDARGRWQLQAGGELIISGSPRQPQARLAQGGRCELVQRGDLLQLRWPCAAAEPGAGSDKAADKIMSWLALRLQGDGLHSAAEPDAPRWAQRLGAASATEAQTAKTEAKTEAKTDSAPDLSVLKRYPAGAYGSAEFSAAPPTVLLRGATLWTSTTAGRLPEHDLLLRDGKIAAIGKNLPAPNGAQVVDARGLHITPGLIDAHSHVAINGGVNEASNSVTAEVRIGDVIDATDVNLYRQLAGGLTTANVLHGSANTIGGQSQVIKLRWGQDAEGLKFVGAEPGIKFALGENVKQSNWGDNSKRYPKSRMGVEQLLRDAFRQAEQYRSQWAEWRQGKRKVEPRKDLQLDTLVELLERRRAIHIHAYRADEMLMFIRLAQEFGLKVAAFQHVLEGYKVAPEIAQLGAGASTFSDWWAYKMEVKDAIPYNAAMMSRAGVLTSFNSDSNELARRLNTEAAKAVRWGGMAEEDALALVTINPARQLGVALRTGSLEVGKDADVVLWSGHPLATSSKTLQTWVDGRKLYDHETDQRLQQQAKAQRSALLAQALPARLAALGRDAGAADGQKNANPRGSAKAPGADDDNALALALAELRLRQWLHEQARWRSSYSDAEGHQCTAELQP